MAGLIIRAKESHDPGNQLQTQKGDIIEVREDDSKFYNLECLDRFLVIHVKGTKAELDYLTQPVTKNVYNSETIMIEEKMVMKHRYSFDIDKNINTEKLVQIKSSNWLVETFDISTITDKLNG